MHTGMLWFDNSESTLETKIRRAAAYYEKKYERKPDLCLVNPVLMGPDQTTIEIQGLEGVTVRSYKPVLPGHIWIGIEDMPTSRKEETPT